MFIMRWSSGRYILRKMSCILTTRILWFTKFAVVILDCSYLSIYSKISSGGNNGNVTNILMEKTMGYLACVNTNGGEYY